MPISIAKCRQFSHNSPWLVALLIYLFHLLHILVFDQRVPIVWTSLGIAAATALLTKARWIKVEILLGYLFALCVIIPNYTRNISFLSWLIIIPMGVPFLLLVRRNSKPLSLIGYGWWTGLILYTGSAPWVWSSVATFAGETHGLAHMKAMLGAPYLVFFILTSLLGVQTCLILVCLGWLQRRGAQWLGFYYVLVFILIDYWMPFPFPNDLATLVTWDPILLQISDLIGARGVGLIACLLSGALFSLFVPAERAHLTRFSRIAWICVLIGAPLFHLGYGALRLSQLRPQPDAPTVDVALIQPCSPLRILNKNHEEKVRVAANLLKLSREAVAMKDSPPDLLVWPEGAGAFSYEKLFHFNPEYSDAIRALQRESSVTLVLSDITFLPPPPGVPFKGVNTRFRYLNHVTLVGPDSNVMGDYTKIMRLPFAEYLPLEQTLMRLKEKWPKLGFAHTLLRKIFPETRSVGKGSGKRILYFPQGRFAAPICYEMIFEDLIRDFVKEGAQFMVNGVNDEWFRSEMQKEQHLMSGMLRGIENRVPIVRATNSGISAIVDARGVILPGHRLPSGEPGVLRMPVVPRGGGSFYTKAGYLFVPVIMTPLMLLLMLRLWLKSRSLRRLEAKAAAQGTARAKRRMKKSSS